MRDYIHAIGNSNLMFMEGIVNLAFVGHSEVGHGVGL